MVQQLFFDVLGDAGWQARFFGMATVSCKCGSEVCKLVIISYLGRSIYEDKKAYDRKRG